MDAGNVLMADEDDELSEEEDAYLSKIGDERASEDVTYIPCTPAACVL